MSSEANEADPAKDDTQKLTERLETLGATNHHLPMENANTIPRSNIHRSVPSVSDIFGPSVLQRASSSEQATATQEAPEETARARHFDDGSAGVSYERVDFANPSRSNNDFYTNARASTRTPEHPPLENSVTQSNSLSSNEVDPGSSTRLSVPNIDASKLNRPRDHHRNVSWGDGLGLNFLSEAEQSQGQHAPVRTEENSLDSYPTITSKDHPTHRNHRPTKSFISLGDATAFSLLSSSPHPRRVVLDDVLKCNPLETEAEALIMRVLEEQENANRDRANTESSPTPANVPEDANIFGDCKEQSSLDYNMEEGSSDDSEIQPFLDDKGADNDKIRGKPGHRRHARRSHERQNTLESHLMDLTEVLNELHGVTSVSDQDHKTLPVDSSSGATLAENANKIFRQNVKADRDGGHTPNIINDIEEGKPDTPRHSQQNGRKFAFGADSENNGGLDLSHVDEGNDEEETSSHQENQSHTGQPALKPYRRRLSAIIHASVDRGPIIDFVTFLSARSKLMRYYTWAYASVVAPLIGIAFILFYLAGNPTTGILTYNVTSIFDPTTNTTTLMNTEGEKFEARTASASWWLLFIVRQLTLFTLANLIQLIVIDFFCLSTRVAADYFGQLVTLFIAQSKGWPFVVFFWGILGFSFLAGKTPWADHWAYWQDVFGLFNYQNPSGSVPSSELYIRILSIAIAVTLVVAIKRLWLGLVLGRKTFRFYAEDLAKVMKKTILLRKVARVNFSGRHSRGKRHSLINPDQYSHLVRFQTKEDYDNNESDNLDDSTKASNKSENNYDDCSDGLIIRNSMGSNGHRVLSHAEKTRLNELLGFWEEPEKEFGIEDSISINAISQFRQSLQFVEDRFMFGIPFGDVSSRENMVINAQKLFQRLNRLDDKEVNSVEISFDVLALAAVDDYGDLDEVMLKDLIRLLRPDRNGKLKLLEFVKVSSKSDRLPGCLDVLTSWLCPSFL